MKAAEEEDRKKNRRCLGRKPVTEFKVGEKYSGKVVYVKPFGAFIDIGCHSDAFCHVSRVRDGRVDDIKRVLSEGTDVVARVVDVDRRAKRITVSLQSDARAEDELKSMALYKEKAEKKKPKDEAAAGGPGSDGAKVQRDGGPDPDERQGALEPEPAPRPVPAAVTPVVKDESEMTHAELKRKRKLERRASRREQQGGEEEAEASSPVEVPSSPRPPTPPPP